MPSLLRKTVDISFIVSLKLVTQSFFETFFFFSPRLNLLPKEVVF